MRSLRRDARGVYRGGKVITLDASKHIAAAMAVEEGKILAVGTEEEFRKSWQDQPGDDRNGRTGRLRE